MPGSSTYIQRLGLDDGGLRLILLTIAISFWRGLGAEKDLFIASVRCAGQLLVMGLVLQCLFRLRE